jgi:hypothetical protein
MCPPEGTEPMLGTQPVLSDAMDADHPGRASLLLRRCCDLTSRSQSRPVPHSDALRSTATLYVRYREARESLRMTGVGAKRPAGSGRKPPVRFGAGKTVKRTFCAAQMNASK